MNADLRRFTQIRATTILFQQAFRSFVVSAFICDGCPLGAAKICVLVLNNSGSLAALGDVYLRR